MQNGDLHLSVFWSDDKTWTRFNIDKETRVYTMTYKCSAGDKMARPLLSVPVFWSILKGHCDRKNKSTYRDYLCGSNKKDTLVNIDDMYFKKLKQMFDHCERGKW